MLPYAAWLCGTILLLLLLLLLLIIIIIIQRISRAPIYRTRWEHRALYNSWWLSSLYRNVHPLEMKINHPKGASGPRRYVIKNGHTRSPFTPWNAFIVSVQLHTPGDPLRSALGNAATTTTTTRKRVVSSVSEETSVLITHSLYCCALSDACVHRPLQVGLRE